MILDALLQLADGQAFTATAYTTNTIDLGDVTPKREVGNGEPMALVFSVGVAADITTGDETYEFQLVQSANANLSSHDVMLSRVVAAALLTVGAKIVIPIAKGSITKRYLGGRMVLGGTTPTITVDADVVPLSMVEEYKAYADGFVIS